MALMKKVLVALLICFLLLPVASAGETLEKPSLKIGDWWKYECEYSYETEFEVLGQIDIEGSADVTVCVVASTTIDGENYWEMKIVGKGEGNAKIGAKIKPFKIRVDGSIHIKKSDFSLLKSDLSIDLEIEDESFADKIATTFDPPFDVMQYPVKKENEKWTSESHITVQSDTLNLGMWNLEEGKITVDGECLYIDNTRCRIKHTDVKDEHNYTIESWSIELGMPTRIDSYSKNGKILEANLVDHGKNKKPTADFTVEKDGLFITVDASNSHDPEESDLTYKWDFGDDFTMRGKTASHSYSKNGNYTITLTVTDEMGATNTTRHSIEISGNKTTSTPGFEFVFVIVAILILLFNKRFRKRFRK